MTEGHGGERGGEGSPSLTSEVAADTKCRREVVEVILRPWEGTGGRCERDARHLGGTRAVGTHQWSSEELGGAPQGLRGWR